MQTSVLLTTLLIMALVTLAFAFVLLRSGPRDDDYSVITLRGYLIRRWWFLFLCAVGVLVSAWSLIPFPLQASSADAPRAVDVRGRMWFWEMDSRTARVGESVRFRVTSADVNHGFALYGPDDRIVAQTQAMPGYVNELDVTFEQPGLYRIRCLEYCGLAHHAMAAEITVTEGS